MSMDESNAASLMKEMKEEKAIRTSTTAASIISSIDSHSRFSFDKAPDGLLPPQYVEMHGHQPEQLAYTAQCYPQSSAPYPPYVMEGFYPGGWDEGQVGSVGSLHVSPVLGPPCVPAAFYGYFGPEYGFSVPYYPSMFPPHACVGYQLQHNHHNPYGLGIAPGFTNCPAQYFEGNVRETSNGSDGYRHSRRYKKRTGSRQSLPKHTNSQNALRSHHLNSQNISETTYDKNMTVLQFEGKLRS